jgi:type III secretion protein N (ATPase)
MTIHQQQDLRPAAVANGADPATEAAIRAQSDLRRAAIFERLSVVPERLRGRAATLQPFRLTGRVRKVVGTIIHAVAPDVQVGELVDLYTRSTGRWLAAEVVGFVGREARLSPIGDTQGVSPATEVSRPAGCSRSSSARS